MVHPLRQVRNGREAVRWLSVSFPLAFPFFFLFLLDAAELLVSFCLSGSCCTECGRVLEYFNFSFEPTFVKDGAGQVRPCSFFLCFLSVF